MKKYTVRHHAVDRALLRFGIGSDQAENWFNQLMMNARFLGKQGGQEYYDHKGKRIVVQETEIVTVMRAEDLPFANKIASLVEKEMKKAKKALVKKERELSIRIAEVTIEQATLTLSFLKAKSPSVKNKINEKLDIVNAELNELNLELQRERDAVNHLEINAQGYLLIGGESA